MKLFLTYLQLEIKRMLRGIPAILIGMFVFLLIFLGISFFGMTKIKETNTNFNEISVALVGGEDDFFTTMAINTVKSMDTVKYSFNFVNTTEEEANQGLKDKKYKVIFIFPENYVQSFMHGENAKVTVRYGHGNPTVVSYIITRMADFMSQIMVNSERNIYATQDYFDLMNLEGESEAVKDLNIKYFKTVLGRDNIFALEHVNATDGISVFTYYFCDGIIILFLLAGLQCGGLLQRRDKTIDGKLKIEGLGVSRALLARLIALTITFSCIYIMVATGATIINSMLIKKGIVLVDGTILEVAWAMAKSSIILIPACMLILCIYEIVNDRAMGVFTLFIVIITLGMVSGCFYPISFMPKIIRDISGWTVTRNMFAYVSECMTGGKSMTYLGIIVFHTVVLFVLTVLIKKYQLRRAS